MKISTLALSLWPIMALAESGYTYSQSVDLNVISSVLATATDTIIIQLVSEFEAAKGTSALISIASLYGSDFLEGSLTDIDSLAQVAATYSGNNNAGNALMTASYVTNITTVTTVSPTSELSVSTTMVNTTTIETLISSPSNSNTASSSRSNSTANGAIKLAINWNWQWSAPLGVAGALVAFL